MWTLDPDDPLRWILLYVQLTANAIMLAMIFNQTPRPGAKGRSNPTESYMLNPLNSNLFNNQ